MSAPERLPLKFAAIDVGSNAVRMLFSQVIGDGIGKNPLFKKEALFRVPLRLGEDSFCKGQISPDNARALTSVLTGFRHLIEAYRPLGVMACGTSALREAANAEAILARAEEASGIRVEVIGAQTEAEMIFANHIEEELPPDRSFLYIDVGGGSTELTYFRPGRPADSASFDIGTIRLLKDLVPESRWKDLKSWVKKRVRDASVEAIGSGGNINKAFRLLRRKEGRPLSLKKMAALLEYLDGFSVEERIRFLQLRPDRADVIVQALKIFVRIMSWGDIRKIFVPQIGLSDGLVHILYENHVGGKSGGHSS